MLIGIVGNKGVGKSLFATYLQDAMKAKGHSIHRTAFADPIKKIVNVLTHYSLVELEDEQVKSSVLPAYFNRKMEPEDWLVAFHWKEWVQWVQDNPDHDLDDIRQYALDMGWNPEGSPTTVRQLLQIIGTEMFRDHINQDIWTELALMTYDDEEVCIVTDVRFPNEAEAIKARGGKLIKIEREHSNKNDQHLSEMLVDLIPTDFIILNNGSLGQLNSKAKDLANLLT